MLIWHLLLLYFITLIISFPPWAGSEVAAGFPAGPFQPQQETVFVPNLGFLEYCIFTTSPSRWRHLSTRDSCSSGQPVHVLPEHPISTSVRLLTPLWDSLTSLPPACAQFCCRRSKTANDLLHLWLAGLCLLLSALLGSAERHSAAAHQEENQLRRKVQNWGFVRINHPAVYSY